MRAAAAGVVLMVVALAAYLNGVDGHPRTAVWMTVLAVLVAAVVVREIGRARRGRISRLGNADRPRRRLG